ncbi:MAG: Crp/Fnr family transcriptional regulator [Rubrivivax sp.]|nr:Crp/Fnr family transcriptional regulator [Rubrivivax sp.]
MPVTPIYRQKARHAQVQVCVACEVRCSALFGALDAQGLERIKADIDNLELTANTRIYGPGSDSDAVYTVRSGMVRFERFTERGDLRIVRLAGPGDLIGLEALLQRPYRDEALCCGPVQLCRIPCELVDKLGQHEGSLQRELMLRWQTDLENAEAWVANLATGPARRRMLRLLLRLADLGPQDGTIWLPRREKIGAMLDLTFETASRLVSQLRREGILELTAMRTARVDTTALRQALQAEDAEGSERPAA